MRNLEGKDSSPLWTQQDSKTVAYPGKKGSLVGADGQVKLRYKIIFSQNKKKEEKKDIHGMGAAAGERSGL